ncbi:hypothetical protein [Nonomuraea sediminis]|uniref:hypothetical protein n=1 Tax=Nonomuraea sediminis TaxID=2835864 RepID=UPI001BDD44F0|nr:hypothetical protein [Nonomuraea sediminis]
MGTETFYATAAQVLPTLMIALTVEVGFLLQLRAKLMENQRAKGGEQRKLPGPTRGELARGSFRFGTVFCFGEVLALLSLGFRWFNVWTFIGVGMSMVILIAAVAVLPYLRFLDEISH